jgi:hypothetical protein
MMHTEQLNELATALAKAQGAMQNAKKDAANPFFKSKYADLASVWDAVREPLTSNGLAVIQSIDCDEHGTVLVTKLAHASGQWIDSKVRVKPVKDDPQGIGSAITYMRRYALQAIVGVSPEDDDGEGAMGRGDGDNSAGPKKGKSRTVSNTQSAPPPTPTQQKTGAINQAQCTRLYAIAGNAKYSKDQMKELLGACGYNSSTEILEKHYNTICESIESTPVDQFRRLVEQLSKWCKEN